MRRLGALLLFSTLCVSGVACRDDPSQPATLPAPMAELLDVSLRLRNAQFDADHYDASVRQLERLAPDHVPEFFAALADADTPIYARGVALRVLCDLNPRPPELEGRVSRLAFDPALAVSNRRTVIVAIPRCLPPATAMPLMQRALSSAETEIRHSALTGLRWMNEGASPLLPLLLQLSAKDPDPEVRCGAAEVMEGIGPRRVEALPALKSAAAAEADIYVRNCLLETIGIIERGPQEVVPAVEPECDGG